MQYQIIFNDNLSRYDLIRHIFDFYQLILDIIKEKLKRQMTAHIYYTKYFTPSVLQAVVASEFFQKNVGFTEINKKYDPITLVCEHVTLTQPNSILKFICEGGQMNGKTQEERHGVSQWFEYFNVELYPILKQLNQQILGEKQQNYEKFNYCINQLKQYLQTLNSHLKIKTFFVGDSITSVDICFAAHLENCFRLLITEQLRKNLPNLTRWFTYIRETGPFLKVYGKSFLCGKTSFEVPKPVLQQPQVKKEEGQPLEAEQSNGKFKIDDFKRQFQNSNQKEKVVENLLDNFDNANWSLWKIHYQKDVTEGKVDFLTMNLASGSLQRLDQLRKNGFGSWGVYGSQGNFEIRGVMLWKGTDIAQEWKDHPSYTYHLFTKLDPKKDEDKKLILDYWLAQPTAQGLPLYDSKKLI